MSVHGDKPIALITATPGGGKTALAVQMMVEAVADGRPVFVMGIAELKVEHLPCPPVEKWTERRPDPDNPELTLPYFVFPERALVVLDEAQRVFRTRPAGSRVPDHVAAFETVRHTGVTFVLITQHPGFLDAHIGKLIGQHVHLRDVGVLGRRYYEWPEVGDPKRYSTAPIKKSYKLPRQVFGLYKSASMHIKRRYSVPPSLIVLGACLVVVAAGSWYVYRSVSQRFVAPVAEKAVGVVAGERASGVSRASVAPAVDRATELLMEFEPRIRSRPETAPAFDALRVVASMPVVAGCIESARACHCYTHQGTEAGLQAGDCRAWLERRPFNAYERVETKTNDVPVAKPVPGKYEGSGERVHGAPRGEQS